MSRTGFTLAFGARGSVAMTRPWRTARGGRLMDWKPRNGRLVPGWCRRFGSGTLDQCNGSDGLNASRRFQPALLEIPVPHAANHGVMGTGAPTGSAGAE